MSDVDLVFWQYKQGVVMDDKEADQGPVHWMLSMRLDFS